MITPQQALSRLIEQREIFYDEMLSLMRQIMGGEVTPAQIAGITHRACASRRKPSARSPRPPR